MQNPFAAVVAELAGEMTPGGDAVAAAVQRHLGGMSLAILPPAAQSDWHRIAALLKVDPAATLAAARIATMHSWPSHRLAMIVDAVRRISGLVEIAENERQHDAIRAQLQRAYL